jgi:hypothetical protein
MFEVIAALGAVLMVIIIMIMRLMGCPCEQWDAIGGGHQMPTPSTAHEANNTVVDEYIHRLTKEIDGKMLAPQYTYDDLGQMPYVNNLRIERQGCHAGQRKLLLTEIEFLSCCAGESDFVIYAGSAPCEKLPVLLAMFPKVKFLLVDPNFHSFNAPEGKPIIIYQNVDVVSPTTLKNTLKDIKLGEKAHMTIEDRKRFANISLNDHPPMYKQTHTADMSRINDADHRAQMHRIQAEFEGENWRHLVSDILAGSARVYIIQDYMTEALCSLIYESKVLADRARNGAANICFISDLRSNCFADTPLDLDFIWNDALQLIFLKMLRPDYSMLKFHPPYMDYQRSLPLVKEMEAGSTKHPMYSVIARDLARCRELGLDFLSVYKAQDHMHKYLKSSTIWLQAWGPVATSEARLIITKDDIASPYQTYSAIEWDEKFMYNKMLRNYAYYGAFYEHMKARGDCTYDGCFDCMLEMMILLNYAYRAPDTPPMMMDPAGLANLLAKSEVQDTLLRLRKQVDDCVVYSPYQKCHFHGMLTRPLDTPIFYINKGDAREVSIWQAWVDKHTGRVMSKKVCERRGHGQVKVMPGVKFVTAMNVPRGLDDRAIARYVERKIRAPMDVFT